VAHKPTFVQGTHHPRRRRNLRGHVGWRRLNNAPQIFTAIDMQTSKFKMRKVQLAIAYINFLAFLEMFSTDWAEFWVEVAEIACREQVNIEKLGMKNLMKIGKNLHNDSW
jgi:hypothetical protein